MIANANRSIVERLMTVVSVHSDRVKSKYLNNYVTYTHSGVSNSTRESVKTHASTGFVTRDLDL